MGVYTVNPTFYLTMVSRPCNVLTHPLHVGEQEWRSGESTRLPPMWPGFKSRRRCHMWVEFVAGSLPCSERFFSGYAGFPLSSKTNTSKFQFDLECTDTFKRVQLLSALCVKKAKKQCVLAATLVVFATFSLPYLMW